MTKSFIFSILFIVIMADQASAGVWTMEACIKYALANNISIRDNELDLRRAELNLTQSRLTQLPSVNASGAYGRSTSSVVDPTSGASTDLNYSFTNFTGNANVLLFGWFARRNIIAKDRLALKSASENNNQLKQDVALNVATGYLRALLAKEQITVSQKQMELTNTRLGQMKIQVSVGTSTELEAMLLESQLSIDSTKYLVANSQYNSAMLDLKALLALSAKDNIEIVSPDDALITTPDLGQISGEGLYDAASQKLGRMNSINYNVEAKEKEYKATAALLLPRLSLVTQLSSVYTNIGKTYSLAGYNNVALPSTYIDVNGTQYPVYQSMPAYSVQQASFSEQLSNNFSGVYALSLNVPIFNGWHVAYNTKSAKIALQEEKNKRDQALIDLRRDTYKAYDEVKIASQKYGAARHAVGVVESALNISEQRLNTGLMTTIEYLQIQNNSYTVKQQMLDSKYDYILKLKIIDYYMGRNIVL